MDMALTFNTRFQFRLDELDAHGELPNSALARLFQETAMRATTKAGYASDWFTARKIVWVVHEMTLEHLRPIHYDDELEISTWLSDMQRVRTHREYLARNAATDEIVARGRAHWAHLSSETLMPARIPQEISERFAPNGMVAVPHLEPRRYAPPSPAPRAFLSSRRVQRYETDAMQHVNNTVYFDWIEETVADAAEEWAGKMFGTGGAARLCVRRHDIAYVRPALARDAVEIVAEQIGAGQCTIVLSVRVKRDNELLVRDQVTALWVDGNGKPIRRK